MWLVSMATNVRIYNYFGRSITLDYNDPDGSHIYTCADALKMFA